MSAFEDNEILEKGPYGRILVMPLMSAMEWKADMGNRHSMQTSDDHRPALDIFKSIRLVARPNQMSNPAVVPIFAD